MVPGKEEPVKYLENGGEEDRETAQQSHHESGHTLLSATKFSHRYRQALDNGQRLNSAIFKQFEVIKI